jgi:hypothetical protein
MYALAASAAGVSILALAPPSQAEIIYTRADVEIPFSLDLNGDGTVDFKFTSHNVRSSNFLGVDAAYAGNGVVGGGSSYAAALLPGAQIGPSANFVSYGRMARGFWYGTNRRSFQWHCYGPWKDVKKHYLGLKFMINGEVHYGWARFNETCHKGLNSAVLTGYAYETIPNQGILAGQKKEAPEDESWTEPDRRTLPSTSVPTPATLGMLSKGAQVLDLWRRE